MRIPLFDKPSRTQRKSIAAVRISDLKDLATHAETLGD
jgi:hypothetical protein